MEESTQQEFELSQKEPTLRQLQSICRTWGFSLKIIQNNGRAVPSLGEAA